MKNWFGEVKTEDNKEYLLRNKGYKLKANTPLSVRFYIKYDTREPPPQLAVLRLNARTICPEGAPTTEAPVIGGQLLTSGPSTVTRPSQPAVPQPAPAQPTSSNVL